jgi:hypothetical protein
MSARNTSLISHMGNPADNFFKKTLRLKNGPITFTSAKNDGGMER